MTQRLRARVTGHRKRFSGSNAGCSAGAAGAVVGELAAQWFNPSADPAKAADTLAFARLMGGIAGALTGDGSAASVNTAATTGANAAQNNYLTHAESSQRLKLKEALANCQDDSCRQQTQAEITRLDKLDVWRDQQIEQACQSPASAACQSWTAAIQVAASSYLGQYGNAVDTAERSSVLNQAFKYQQAVNNPLLYGVGKGLLKLTPPGLAAGALGGIAATVQSLAEQGLTQTVIDAVKGLSDIPADLRARLDSSDPSVRGEALVDLVSLGAGATAVGAGGVKYAITALERGKINAAIATAEKEALARARVDNNASADMAGFGSSAVRDFQPGTTHRAENINAGQVTDRDGLPRIDDAKTSMDQSQGLNHYDWLTQRPAWKEGTTVTDRITTQPETYRMVVNEDKFDAISKALQKGDVESAAKNLGSWATKDTVTGVSDVRNNLAISSEWKGQDGQRMYVVEFTVQPGVGVREGVVGPMHDAQAKVTLPGGGHQVQFMDKSPYTNPNLFKIDLSKAKELK